jgi:hypothetical protein
MGQWKPTDIQNNPSKTLYRFSNSDHLKWGNTRWTEKKIENACCNAPNTCVATRRSLAFNGQHKNPSTILNAQPEQNLTTFLVGLWQTKDMLPNFWTLNTLKHWIPRQSTFFPGGRGNHVVYGHVWEWWDPMELCKGSNVSGGIWRKGGYQSRLRAIRQNMAHRLLV